MKTVTQCVELRADRARLIHQAGDLITKSKAEKRAMTAEEAEQFDKLHAAADELKAQIDREERQNELASELATVPAPVAAGREQRGTPPDAKGDDVALRNAAITAWVRGGMEELAPEQRQVMRSLYSVDPEVRAQSVGTTTAGGYTVAPDTSMYAAIEAATKAFTWFDAAGVTQINTATGANMPIPTSDDTSNSGALLAENTQASTQDITFGQVSLDAYMYTSKIVLVSLQLLQDSAINVDAFVGSRLGERLGRIFASQATTGTGSSQPNGVITAATLGKTAASTTAFTYNEVLDLIHSVDPTYRPNARLMFHDNILLAFKKLQDSQNRPLFIPGFAYGEPDTIAGYRYAVNQNMASALTTGQKVIAFGDFSKYIVRRSGGLQMLRLTERYADFLQVGFLSFARFDSELLDAGTHPVKYLALA